MLSGRLAVISFIFFVLIALSPPSAAQGNASHQVALSDIGNATVTLYYYDNTNGTRGGIVPMPDNPQQVNADPGIAAPGMYAFSHVPAGQWYYLEAEHSGKRWYSIFYMAEGEGTQTANVAIPLTPVDAVAARPSPSVATPSATPVPTPVTTPAPSPSPSPAPGLLPALLSLLIPAAALAKRR